MGGVIWHVFIAFKSFLNSYCTNSIDGTRKHSLEMSVRKLNIAVILLMPVGEKEEILF